MNFSNVAHRCLAVPALSVLALSVQAEPVALPPGVGVVLETFSLTYGNGANAAAFYTSQAGLSSSAPSAGFQLYSGSAANNVFNPPNGFSPQQTSASLEQITTNPALPEGQVKSTTAKAEASLEQGVLRASASSAGPMLGCGSQCTTSGSTMFAAAQLSDVVTLHDATGGKGTVKLHVSGHVDGSMGAGPYSLASGNLHFKFGLVGFSMLDFAWSSDANGPVGTGPDLGPQWADWVLSNATATGLDFEGDFMLPLETEIPIYGYLGVQASNGMVADFSHTALFDFTLPQGVTFESASKVLLSAGNPGSPGNPVPEPASWALAVVALAGLGHGTRRRPA